MTVSERVRMARFLLQLEENADKRTDENGTTTYSLDGNDLVTVSYRRNEES